MDEENRKKEKKEEDQPNTGDYALWERGSILRGLDGVLIGHELGHEQKRQYSDWTSAGE